MMKKSLLIILAVSVFACKSSLEKEITDPTVPAPNPPVVINTISFSGYNWKVKNSGTDTYGPGPNYWDKKNVWVDSLGILHLKLRKDPATNRWSCAEVQSVNSFGYGTYEWKVNGAIHALNKNVVLGLFNYSGTDGIDEMDIEFARWGVDSNPILNYTVYPAQTSFPVFHTERNFTLPEGTFTTHRFKRTSHTVTYKSLYGFQDADQNLFATDTCTVPRHKVSALSMPIFMNLWLFRGTPPSDQKEVEILIHSFKFTPIQD